MVLTWEQQKSKEWDMEYNLWEPPDNTNAFLQPEDTFENEELRLE